LIVILREAAAKIETGDGQVGIVTRSFENTCKVCY